MTTKTTKTAVKSSKPSIKNASKSQAKAAPAKQAKKERKPSMSATARALILAGKSNAEVFKVLHAQFGLSEIHKAYASWFRAQLVRLERKANGAKAAEVLHAKLAKTA
jgi:hypothetical protein